MQYTFHFLLRIPWSFTIYNIIYRSISCILLDKRKILCWAECGQCWMDRLQFAEYVRKGKKILLFVDIIRDNVWIPNLWRRCVPGVIGLLKFNDTAIGPHHRLLHNIFSKAKIIFEFSYQICPSSIYVMRETASHWRLIKEKWMKRIDSDLDHAAKCNSLSVSNSKLI